MSYRIIGPTCARITCTKPALTDGLCHAHHCLALAFPPAPPDPRPPPDALEALWTLPAVAHPLGRAA